MTIEKIRELISRMSLEEKASLLSGGDFWHTKGIERLGIPATMLSDGPHGLRKQEEEADHLGVNESIKAVCFPAGCASAASFDRELLEEQGRHIGTECQAENISVVLGPAMNIKRSPLCGRNFEYLSEDPYLAGELASALVKGIQSKNIGTSPKHFAVNNQENRRMSVSAEVDERTIREIYLPGFEKVVKETKPWTIMCSYNRINGTYSAQNQWLLTDVLRKEWGFDGYVVSDWGAVDERIADVKAGMNLEMPSSGGVNDGRIVAAVKAGELDEAVVDKNVEEILNIIFRYEENRDNTAVFDREGDHELARKVAEESMVLLKNNGVLPLAQEDAVVFIGQYAEKPRYQGGGSSHINSFKVTSAVEAAADYKNVTYVRGYDDKQEELDEAMLTEAVEAARKAKAAVIFAGLPDSFESEGYDREHMKMPQNQNRLISEIAKVQPNTVVVLHNGSPIEMPWIDEVAAVLECYLGGQAVGAAQVNVLFGKVNPSGKLAETFPLCLEDNPSYLNFPGEGDTVKYQEGVFVGYRYYDAKKMEVLFPFGHGLSYTRFAYSNLVLDKKNIKDTDTLTVSVDVTNIGDCIGKEVVQLYVENARGAVTRPEQELKGFEKVSLMPGETKTVTFTLEKRAFAYWNTSLSDWHVESGSYRIKIGGSSRDIAVEEAVEVISTQELFKVYTPHSTIGDIMANPKLAEFAENLKNQMGFGPDGAQEESATGQEAITPEMQMAMMRDMPLRSLISFSTGAVTYDMVMGMVAQINEINAK